MWAVVVYPPLVVPVRIGLPSSCPCCRTHEMPHIHERLVRKVANVDPTFTYGENWTLVAAYETVRFRCPRCGKITAPTPPSTVPGFRFQRMIAARLLSAYCLGEAVDHILEQLESDGITLSRATTYRFLETFAGEEVEALRKENRRRARRARRADVTLARYGYFYAEIADRSANMGPMLQIGAEDDPAEGSTADVFLDVYRKVQVLRLYNDATAVATLDCVNRYLTQQGSAGVILAASLRDLERRFDPYTPRLKKKWNYKLASNVLSSTQLYGALDTNLPVIRETIWAAIRYAVWDVRERAPGTSPVMPDHRLYNYP
jgi:hypothetical protein